MTDSTMTPGYAQKVIRVAEQCRLDGRNRLFNDADRALIRQAHAVFWDDVWNGGQASSAETPTQQLWDDVWRNSHAV